MSRALAQLTVAVLLILAVLMLHSCIRGPVYDDAYSIMNITQPPEIRIGLSRALNVPSIRLSIGGAYRILSAEGANILYEGDRLVAETVMPFDGGILIGPTRKILHDTIRIAPYGGATMTVGDRTYGGSILVYRKGSQISLVNAVDLELYLAGVIPREMSLTEPPEALKAQITAARTYALYEMKDRVVTRPAALHDLYDDQRSQVYEGICDDVDYARRLVRETRGDVITFNQSLVRAYYSSTCGGHTEPAWQVLDRGLPRIAPLGGRECGKCGASKYFRWEVALPKRELIEKLFPGRSDVKTIDAIRVVSAGPGGHAFTVGIKIPNEPKEIVVDANEGFRYKINRGAEGKKILRSTLFKVVPDGGDFRFVGNGFGHAVGMCQVGAYQLAREGLAADDILLYYYPGASIKKLY